MSNKEKQLTVKDLYEKFKECKEYDFTSVKSYDLCIKTGNIFTKNLKESYSLYDETVDAVETSIERLQLEKAYKIKLSKDVENGFGVIDYATQLRYIRDKEIPKWKTLDKLIEVKKDKNLEVINSRDITNFPIGSFLTITVFLLLMYLIHSLLSGKIFKYKLINQLEVLEQEDLADLLKKDIRIDQTKYKFKKKGEGEFLTTEEKILIKNIDKNRSLIEDAYRKYITPVTDEMTEDEIGKIQEEIRILLYEFYDKIGINLSQKSENLPFNDDSEEENE